MGVYTSYLHLKKKKKISFGHPDRVPIMSKCYLEKKFPSGHLACVPMNSIEIRRVLIYTIWEKKKKFILGTPYKFEFNSMRNFPSSNLYYLENKYFFQFDTVVLSL